MSELSGNIAIWLGYFYKKWQ